MEIDFQVVGVILLFLGALFYVLRLIFRAINPKKDTGCASGCNKCPASFSDPNNSTP